MPFLEIVTFDWNMFSTSQTQVIVEIHFPRTDISDFSSFGFSLWGHTLSLGGNVSGHMFHVFIVEGVNLCPRNVDSFSDCSHVRLKNRAGTRCRLNWHLSGKMKHSCVQLFFTFLNLAFLFVCTASKINISQLYKKTSWFYFSTFPLFHFDKWTEGSGTWVHKSSFLGLNGSLARLSFL